MVSDIGDTSRGIHPRVFVYERVGSDWQLTATLPDSGGALLWSSFGESVTIDGDTIVVGAPTSGNRVGATFFFSFDGVQWNEDASFFSPTPERGAEYGRSVALDGDGCAVSEPGLARVYVYRRLAGVWALDALLDESQSGLTPRNPDATGFGLALDLQGTTLAIGMPWRDFPSQNAGAVVLFEESASTWQYAGAVLPQNAGTDTWFGARLDLEADSLVVGSPFRLSPLGAASGSATLFARSESGWNQKAEYFSG